ncbi:MAG: UDP-N-acetylmuramate dehydrogenase [Alphaproteobacteria bacterium]|nr:UDP-N-acetylmuramate dehydrogenase [Alphaproteobacteria bacterium]
MTAGRKKTLLDRLPPVRGRYSADVPLDAVTWFRVGGRAEVVFRPSDADDLAQFLAARPAEVPVSVIGVGSNLLVRDGGVEGVVIRLGRGFAGIAREAGGLRAGAAALDVNVALFALEARLAGLEFLRGIPGTIGGALRMNAGAYGREIADVLIEAEAVDGQGRMHRFEARELGLSYRHCALSEDYIFTGALLAAQPGAAEEIAARMAEISRSREATQPVRTRTGGSTFANPVDPAAGGLKAWQLIDQAGCRGLRIGGAQVSELHCNFLINTGDATAADLEALGEEVRRRVKERFGVTLQWEIRRIGRPAARLEVAS